MLSTSVRLQIQDGVSPRRLRFDLGCHYGVGIDQIFGSPLHEPRRTLNSS